MSQPVAPSISPEQLDQLMRSLETPVIVTGDTPIEAAMSAMRKAATSSALVMESHETKPSGIFTDRDIFLKLTTPHPPRLSDPIRVVMTRNVVTLAPEMMHLAPELMAQRGFRHVPIIRQTGRPGAETVQVLGVLTMDGLFRSAILDERAWRNPLALQGAARSTIGVYGYDPYLNGAILTKLAEKPGVTARRIRRADVIHTASLAQLAESFDGVVIDIDSTNPKVWARLLAVENRSSHVRGILVVYTPELHEADSLEVIRKLQDADRFQVRAKPIDTADLNELLEKLAHAVSKLPI